MPRRRVLSFSAYTRRKWRAVGLTLVLMAGTLLYLTITDRGHEPLWMERAAGVEQVAASPDGSIVLAVLGDSDRVTRVRGYDTATGDVAWDREVDMAAPVSLAAGDGWFAVASPFPRARLAVYNATDGEVRVSEFLNGAPRAVVADGPLLALALRRDTVVLYEDLAPVATHEVGGLVATVHAAGGRVAVGTTDGRVVVVERDEEVVNLSTRLQPQSLRLSRDGTELFVAGAPLEDGAFGGAVSAFRLEADEPQTPVWHHATTGRMGLVAVGAGGERVIAVEETLPRYTLHAWAADGSGVPQWSLRLAGPVFRDDAGLAGGLDVSPDGRFIALATTLGGNLALLDAATGRTEWEFLAEGGSSVSFPSNVADGRFAANARIIANRPFDQVLVFDAASEPVTARWPWFALGLMSVELLGGVAAVSAGYWWYRRS